MTASILTRTASLLLAAILIALSASWVSAQTTGFTYQGRLTDGDNPADSFYDFEFKLFDALTDGSQQGSTAQLLNVEVKRGVFTVQLDFGNQFTGASRYLEISLRPSGPGAFTLLTPRQPVTSNPYAIKSLNSSTADGLSLACVNCVASSQIQSIQGSKVTGSISGSQVNGFIPVASIPAGSNSYIQNGGAGQAADFNITGEAVAGSVESNTAYYIGGSRVLGIPGVNNTFTGLGAGLANLTGGNNAFFGSEAGIANSSGSFNTFSGRSAGQANTTGGSNSFFGRNAGLANTTGSSNTLIGSHADVASGNLVFATAIGGNAVVSTSNTIILGRSGGQDTVQVPGTLNVAAQYNIGGNRILSAEGTDNIFVGRSTGVSNSTGSSNAFFGRSAGLSNTTGNNNSFVGRSAGLLNTTGVFNSFFGSLTGDSNTTGDNNTFVGAAAGSGNTGGNSNTFVGLQAGESNTTGSQNAFFGVNAGQLNTTGSSNTYIGNNARGNADITNATAIGANAFVNFSNQIMLGTASNIVLVPGPLSIASLRIMTLAPSGSTAVCRNALNDLATCSSSLRYKTNIEPFDAGLELVQRLRPITFSWKDGAMRDLGLGAEDVAAIEPLLVTYNKDGQVEGVKYDRIGVVLLNAVRQQQEIINVQQQQLDSQQKMFEDLRREIERLKKVYFSARPTISRGRARRK